MFVHIRSKTNSGATLTLVIHNALQTARACLCGTPYSFLPYHVEGGIEAYLAFNG